MKQLLIIISLFSILIPIYPYTSLYTESIGEFNLPIFSVSAGAGSNELFFNPIINPSLRFSKDKYFVGIGFSGLSHRETRTKYIFDTYDNNVGKKNIYDNSFLYGEPAYIIGYMPVAMFGLSMGYENLISKDYTFNQIFRDDNYVTLYTTNKVQSGNINGYFLSLSYSYSALNAGVNLTILQGDGADDYSIIYVDPSKTDSTWSADEQYSGIRGGAALSYTVMHVFEMAVAYQMQTTVKNKVSYQVLALDTFESASEIDYILPNTISAGIKYTPANVSPVCLMASATYERWTELNGDFKDYNDIIKYNVGVTHQISDKVKFLYGMLYEPYKKNNHTADVGFSSGFTVNVSQTEFTLSAQYRQTQIEAEGIYFTDRVLRLNADVTIVF